MNFEHICPLVRWILPLPSGYGQDENERCVEVPLALEVARLDQPGLVLDAGGSLNLFEVRQHGIWQARLWHYTQSLASEPIAACRDSVSYLCGDLRHLELADGTCDRVVCVSTLEHIGMDNRQYGGVLETEPSSALNAVRELWRVLKPGGTLFLSFPYGQELQECGGRYRTLGPDDVANIRYVLSAHSLTSAHIQPPSVLASRYFLRTPQGWTDADASIARGLAEGGKPVLGLCCLRAEK